MDWQLQEILCNLQGWRDKGKKMHYLPFQEPGPLGRVEPWRSGIDGFCSKGHQARSWDSEEGSQAMSWAQQRFYCLSGLVIESGGAGRECLPVGNGSTEKNQLDPDTA